MANTTHEASPAALPPSITNPPPPTSPKPPENNAQLASLADASLGVSSPTKSLKRPFQDDLEPPPLTGVAAMVDQKRYDEERKAQEAQIKTVNPAAAAKTALMGGAAPEMSKPADAPPARSVSPREQLPAMTDKQPVEEPMQIDNDQSASTSSSTERPRPEGANSHTSASTGGSAPDSLTSHPRLDERPNKAMTYPPPPSSDPPETPGHRLSLPTTSTQTNSKSPSSAKKHKCPHCSTEFTRHHNLKSHLLTHSQEKPYGCGQCSSRFRRLHDLKRHLKLHTGERPHKCEKCGRKFARGDALARHSKGPGGCAGRRGSGGDEYDDAEEMDGVVYHGEGSDPDRPDDEEGNRRASEPNKMRKTSLHSRIDSGSSGYRHSSTFPGPTSMSSSRSLYPPQPQGSSSTNGGSNQNSSQHLSPKPPHTTFSQVHYNSPSMFQGGMTESPKPLSPGQQDHHRLSHSESSYPRARSPSLTSQLQQQHISRNSERSTPPVGLPPPSMSHAPQLPSLPGLGPDPRHPYPPHGHQSGSIKPPPPVISTQGGPHSSSNPGSATHSSGSSMRELLGRGSGEQPSSDMIEYMHQMERRLHEEMQQKLQSQERHYEAKIQRLQEEVNTLRSQQGHSITSQPQRSGSR